MEFNIEDDVSDSKTNLNTKENAQFIICSEIKKQGNQKKFCEEKFLNSDEVTKKLFPN